MNVVLMTTVPLSLRFLRGHVRLLQDKGTVVHVISSPGPALDKFANNHQVAAHGIEMTRRMSPIRDLAALWRLIALLRRIRPDIVHAHTPKAGLLGMLAARIANVPCRFYHIHGLPFATASRFKRRILQLCDVVACRLAHRVFCVSRSLEQVVETEGICSSSKLSVLANGTIDGIDALGQFDPSRFSTSDRAAHRQSLGIPAEAAVFGFVGRIVKDKGIEELLDAFARLESEFPDVHLLVVGPFEDRQRIAPRKVELLETHPRIHHVGFAEDPAPYYSIMNVLALPSHREGFGLVAAEAAAMEVPVVATRIVGCVDAVCDGRSGTLVPANDAAALASAVARYLREPGLAREHGATGRIRVLKDFQPEAVHSALWSCYEAVLNGETTRRRPKQEPKPRRQHFAYGDGGKRVFDVALASALLMLLAPLLAVVGLAVRWRLGSPALFWQQRPGLRSRLFWMPKFRTMTDRRDGSGELLPDEMRLTPFGRFLRSTSLDELPELWCVLRGDMSFVGPRPLLKEYLSCYTPEQARRHDVKPGITGWAQINGRNAISWPEKFKRDLWYVDHLSFAIDMKILFGTFAAVFSQRGVAADGHATMPRFDVQTNLALNHEQAA